MAPDTFLDADRPSRISVSAGNSYASLRTMLSRELRFAEADYRTLALHAGPSDRITLDAKQLVTRLSVLLQEEIERLRSEGRKQQG